MQQNKPKPKGLLRFRHTILYSISGFKYAWKYEESFRQEFFILIFSIPASIFVAQNLYDYFFLIGSVVFLSIVELINSAVEATVDRISLEKHELSKRAKDIGSAAVMLSILSVLAIWGSIIYMNLLQH